MCATTRMNPEDIMLNQSSQTLHDSTHMKQSNSETEEKRGHQGLGAGSGDLLFHRYSGSVSDMKHLGDEYWQ